MKKLIALLLIGILAVSLCACASDKGTNKKNSYDDDIKKLEDSIGQLEDAYDKAKENADNFRSDVDDYYNALNELEKYN